MKNNNQAIVRKITSRTLQVNFKRNFFITVAIALTAFMIASVFSVGMGYYQSMTVMPFRFEGTRVHVGFMGLDDEQIETIRRTNFVRHIAFGTPTLDPVGVMNLFDCPLQGVTMLYTCRSSWNNFQTPTFTNVVGRYATGENEIMLSRTKLERMGIENPYAGMEIPLDFVIHGQEEILHKNFVLSAIYTEFVSVHPNAGTPVFVSQAFAERHGRYIPGNFAINIIFRNQNRAYDYSRQLIETLNLREGQTYGIHPAIQRGIEINTTTMYTAMGIIVAFLMFVGFLLIYNVMFVSVSKDVRFYGLLKTLGTTPRQLRRVVNGQVLRLYAIGLPVGLGIAAAASLVLVPLFMGDHTIISFSPLIYIGGAVFTLLTTYLSAFTSAGKAARVSPIEAIRYAGEQRVNVKARSSARGKPWRMAWRNTFRERKQATVVLISLFLGVTVFTTIMTIVNGYDIDSELAALHTHDFNISNPTGGVPRYDPAFTGEIANIPNVTNVYELNMTVGKIPALQTLGGIYAIDTAWILLLYPQLDVAAFERGEIALLDGGAVNIGDRIANEALYPGMFVDMLLGDREIPTSNVKIGSVTQYRLAGASISNPNYLHMSLIMSNVFLQQKVDDLRFISLAVNVRRGTDSQVNAYLQNMPGEDRRIISRYQSRQRMEEERLVMFALGAGISAILGTIGIFNFINVISVGLLVRKREFAALESVGMSKKQMRSMLRWEGAVYWMLTIAASLTAGTAIAYWMFTLMSSSNPTQFPNFVYPVVPVAAAYVLIIIICSAVPELAYRSISKMTLVERLREAE
ncbi:MAG: ABC transporter permease [Firmicutes bacterium]|nr:ABC transporter permease [Bacillota bacterium]